MKLTPYNSPFARVFGADFDRLFGGRYAAPTSYSSNSYTGADVYEDDGAYFLQVDLPGVKKDHLAVELDGDQLVVSIERKDEGESLEHWKRTVSVPDDVVAENVGAKLEDGVLTVTLPKAEARKPLQINIS